MPETFSYKVRDKTGKLVEGQLEAENAQLVVSKLRAELIRRKHQPKRLSLPHSTTRTPRLPDLTPSSLPQRLAGPFKQGL